MVTLQRWTDILQFFVRLHLISLIQSIHFFFSPQLEARRTSDNQKSFCFIQSPLGKEYKRIFSQQEKICCYIQVVYWPVRNGTRQEKKQGFFVCFSVQNNCGRNLSGHRIVCLGVTLAFTKFTSFPTSNLAQRKCFISRGYEVIFVL